MSASTEPPEDERDDSPTADRTIAEAEIILLNACTDLVSSRKYEAFPTHLLTNRRTGEWVAVRDLCLQTNLPSGDLGADLFVTWLPDPMGHEGYVVVLFFEDESKWSMAAHYNRARLVVGTSEGASSWPVETVISTSRGAPHESFAGPKLPPSPGDSRLSPSSP